MSLVWTGKPGERFQLAKKFEVCRTCFVFIVHIDIYEITLFRSRSMYKTNCSLMMRILFFAEHIHARKGEHEANLEGGQDPPHSRSTISRLTTVLRPAGAPEGDGFQAKNLRRLPFPYSASRP